MSTLDSWLHFLDQAANPVAAEKMKQYMRNRFEFLGIPTPIRRKMFAQMRAEHPCLTMRETEELTRLLWKSPYRVYHYCAIELLDKKKKHFETRHSELLEYLIVTHSWWDSVDIIASHLAGAYMKQFPEQTHQLINRWMKSNNLWLQRTCILYQLSYKGDTNLASLEKIILQLRDEKDFFLRKAIGWALREYSKTDAAWVISFVKKYELSSLSRIEALKWLHHKGEID